MSNNSSCEVLFFFVGFKSIFIPLIPKELKIEFKTDDIELPVFFHISDTLVESPLIDSIAWFISL